MSFGGWGAPGGGQRMKAENERRDEQIAAGEAHQEQRRLAKEAVAARGGTPLHRAWRRLTGVFGTEERRAPAH